MARQYKYKVIIGNLKNETVLLEANIEDAKSIIVCTSNDLLNLEVALNARKHREDINIVMRMFDQDLAKKISDAFDIHVALSSSELAAPVFAAASFDETVLRSVRIDNTLFVSAKLIVKPDSFLEGKSIIDLTLKNLAILKLETKNETLLFPKKDYTLQAGDCMYITCTMEELEELKK